MVAAVITGQASALPPPLDQSALWDGFFAAHYAGDPRAERIFRGAAITSRHAVVDPRVEDASGWGTGARMQRFVEEATPLGKEALAGALADAGLSAAEVGLLVVVSCTGYATPGLDIALARDLGMRADVQRLHIGHMGCYAAIPALGAAADFVRSRRRPAVVLCVELTSLHVQPPSTDLQQVVAHALFSDAAAAVVLQPDAPRGLELLDVGSITDPTTSDHMTWDVTDQGFRMGLSPRVPGVLAVHAAPSVRALLAPYALDPAEVPFWAVHPGGKRIVEVVAAALRLTPDQVADSLDVLDRHGNCSSATVLLVLEQLRRRVTPAPGDALVAMAFGPGLTLCSALLQAR